VAVEIGVETHDEGPRGVVRVDVDVHGSRGAGCARREGERFGLSRGHAVPQRLHRFVTGDRATVVKKLRVRNLGIEGLPAGVVFHGSRHLGMAP
jgi:hypothetical protein